MTTIFGITQETIVNNTSAPHAGYNQENPDVAVDSSGNFIVIWDGVNDVVTIPDFPLYAVYGQRFSASSTKLGGEFQINSYDTYEQNSVSVAVGGTGSFIAVWDSYFQSPDSEYGVYARRYNSITSGTTTSGTNDVLVNTTTDGFQENPSVAMDGNGNYVVAWQGNGTGGDGDDIYIQRFNSSGGVLQGQTKVNTANGIIETDSIVAMNSSGMFVVVWTGNNEVFFALYNSSGNVIKSPTQVNQTSTNVQNQPTVAINDNGEFAIAWSSTQGDTSDIYARKFNSAGNAVAGTLGNETLVHATTAGEQVAADIEIDNNGNFVVVWQDNDAEGTGTDGIYARRFISTGADGGAVRVNETTTNNQTQPAIAMNNNGDFVVTWVSDQVTTNDKNIYVRQFIINTNTAPTDVTFSNTITSIAENTSTATPVKVADINVVDDGMGSANLTLSGADASSFVITNNALYIQSGVSLNFEVKSAYTVTVNVDDPTVGTNPDASRVFNLTVTNVNEAPTAANLANTVTTLAENTNTSNAIKVADISITDDALGTETLTLTGADASSFAIISGALYLQAGVTLDFETKSSYNVMVNVDDTAVGGTPDFALPFTLSITDVNEAPTAASLANTVTTLAENTNTSNVIKLADISITDDALGTETLTLTGADASSFTIIGGALYLQAGVTLDFETKSSYNVMVNVDDTDVGGTPDFSLPFTLSITDVNEGTTGGDVITGTAGDDVIEGLDGNDYLIGNGGNDALNGGTGNDYAFGGMGNDAIDGGEGSDFLYGNDGNDTIFGGDGNDNLDGGAGDDRLEGGAGNDIYTVDSLGDVVVENPGAGTDKVNSSITWTLGDNVENLTLLGNNPINGTGNELDNHIVGNNAANTLTGLDGNDWLMGKAGNDNLIGGNGNDRLDGGTGDDILDGGAGNDIYEVDSAGDQITEAVDGGIDTVFSLIDWNLGKDLENLTLVGNQAINATGNSLANRLSGNNANNTLTGLDGNDYLSGENGSDTLIGGAGNDTLVSGSGADNFDLTGVLSGGFDTIQDLNNSEDTVQLSGAEFGISPGALNPSLFVLGSTATSASDRFIYNQNTGVLFFDNDGSGSNAQVQIALFANRAVLSSTNFTVIA